MGNSRNITWNCLWFTNTLININQTIFMITFAITVILGIFSLIKINKFNEYKKTYKQILTQPKCLCSTKSNKYRYYKR